MSCRDRPGARRKVNLRLAVGPPRADGYHELVNVFHAVSLFDEVPRGAGPTWRDPEPTSR